METILIPHTADQASARLWICITGTDTVPGNVPVTLSNGSRVIAAGANWKPVTGGGALSAAESRTFTQVVEFTGLTSGTAFVATANGATAKISTLPVALPQLGGPTFSILLGSCYFASNDRGVGSLVDSLLKSVQPTIKFLCGDQVYLDFPSFVLGVPFDRKGKARLFLSRYLRNWGQLNSYRPLLQEGATYFSSDDHEFWNNFPNAATIISATWTKGGRDEYKSVARALFDDFQVDSPLGARICRPLRVGNLSFMVADTRLDRDEGDSLFMKESDMDTVVDWIATLPGPGVLVVGQPVFADSQTGFFGGIKKRFGDRSLPDYAQYKRLADALLAAQHSVLILTGDVHYPRVAQATRPGQAGREIIEVIASPAALVAGGHTKTKDAPGKFPARPSAGASMTIETQKESRHAGDNLVTMSFTETPGKIDVELKYWFVGESNLGNTIHLSLT